MIVMAGLVPAIQMRGGLSGALQSPRIWIAGTGPAMTI